MLLPSHRVDSDALQVEAVAMDAEHQVAGDSHDGEVARDLGPGSHNPLGVEHPPGVGSRLAGAGVGLDPE